MSIKKQSYVGINYCLRCGGIMHYHQDREDKLRKICEKCGWVYYKNPIPAAACVILNEKAEILIIKRLLEPNPGEWALPSGYIEIDQSPEEAAVTEMLEETGLEGKVKKFLGYFHGYSPIYERVISFGYLMEIVGGKLEAGDDAGEAKFVRYADLPKLAFTAHDYFVEQTFKELK